MSYLDYALRGENAWWRYLVSFALALVITVVLALVILVPLQLAGLVTADLANQVQAAGDPGFYPFIGATFAVLLVAFWLASRWVLKKRFGDILGAWTWGRWAAGFAIWSA